MSNKPKTRAQKFDAWWHKHGSTFDRGVQQDAWLAGYLAGYRTRQYEGDQRGKVQRADRGRKV